jgi:hypothetical protein
MRDTDSWTHELMLLATLALIVVAVYLGRG